MAFCRFCGTEIPDGNICDSCKAAQLVSETDPVSGSNGNNKKGLAVMGAAVVVVVILIVAIISSVAGGGYKEPINDMIKGFNKADSEKLLESFYPEDYLEKLAENLDDEDIDELYDTADELIEKSKKSIEKEYGKNIKVSFDFKSKKKITNEKKIDYYEDWYDTYLSMDAEVVKAYKVKGTLEVKGKKDKSSASVEFVVVKIKGEGWKIYPNEGDADFFNVSERFGF